MEFLQKLLNRPNVLLEFDDHWELTGSAKAKDTFLPSEDALESLQELVTYCKMLKPVCRPILPVCDIDGIYQKNEIYFEVDCVWNDSRERTSITIKRVTKEYTEQKSKETIQTLENLSPDFSSLHDIYPLDYPENYSNVIIDENFIAIYEKPEDSKDLNEIGNFWRRNHIHNDVWRTIKRMRSKKNDFTIINKFHSDNFKIEVMIKTRNY